MKLSKTLLQREPEMEKLPSNNDTEVDNQSSREKLRNIICFFFLGVFSMVYNETSVAAAEDILAGSKIATTAVILALSLPLIGVKVSAPWFLQMCSYWIKTCITVVLLLTGLSVLVSAQHVHLRLAGVSIIDMGGSLGEISFLALTAAYQEITVSAFVAGIGTSSLIGPLYYTVLTTWFCLPPRITIMTTIPWPFLILILYAALEKKETGNSKAEYSALMMNDPDSAQGSGSKTESTMTEKAPTCPGGLALREKLSVAKQILPYITFLFVTYFAEYLSNQSIITTLAFSNAPFSPRDHYQYYILCYHLGKFLGRSHIFFISCTFPKLVSYVSIRKTWILAVIEIGLMIFFLFSSWFRFVPHVSIILILCATEGFIAGSMYINSAVTVSEVVVDPKQKEFALGLLTFGNAVGQLSAGLVGLQVEPHLENHCMKDLNLDNECITRFYLESGWTTNTHC